MRYSGASSADPRKHGRRARMSRALRWSKGIPMVARVAVSNPAERPHRAAPGIVISCGAACALLLAAGATAWSATFDCVINPSLTLKLGSPVASILDSVDVERGDLVKRGQVIARLESKVEQATVAVNEARAESMSEIEAKKAVVDLKRGVLARKVSLQKSYASAQDIEIAQAEYNVAIQELAEATVSHHVAQLDLNRAKAALEIRTIRSPIDGVIDKRALGPGEYVHQEASIVTVARIDPLYVETFLPVRYFGLIKIGNTANVRPDDPVGGDRNAAVTVVDEVFDAASGTFGVRLALPNPEHIVPAGLRCRITFDVHEQTVRAPASGILLNR
jgi:RND family efflux transporter MFP subunit